MPCQNMITDHDLMLWSECSMISSRLNSRVSFTMYPATSASDGNLSLISLYITRNLLYNWTTRLNDSLSNARHTRRMNSPTCILQHIKSYLNWPKVKKKLLSQWTVHKRTELSYGGNTCGSEEERLKAFLENNKSWSCCDIAWQAVRETASSDWKGTVTDWKNMVTDRWQQWTAFVRSLTAKMAMTGDSGVWVGNKLDVVREITWSETMQTSSNDHYQLAIVQTSAKQLHHWRPQHSFSNWSRLTTQIHAATDSRVCYKFTNYFKVKDARCNFFITLSTKNTTL